MRCVDLSTSSTKANSASGSLPAMTLENRSCSKAFGEIAPKSSSGVKKGLRRRSNYVPLKAGRWRGEGGPGNARRSEQQVLTCEKTAAGAAMTSFRSGTRATGRVSAELAWIPTLGPKANAGG